MVAVQALLVEDEQADVEEITGCLESAAPYITLTVVSSLAAAKTALSGQTFDVIILDHTLPDGSGLDLLRHLQEISSDAVRIVTTEHGNYEYLVDALKQGAAKSLTKGDCYWQCLPLMIEQEMEFRRQLEAARREQPTPDEITYLRDELMSHIAHEVKTPLTSILGFAHMMMSHPDAPVEKREKWARFIHTKSELLTRLVDNMLDLARLQSNELPLHLRLVDLGEMLRDAVEEVAITAPGRVIEIDIPADLPSVMVDADQMSRVLVNLLVYAHNASPPDQLIRATIRVNGDALQVGVTDYGRAIALEEQNHIFEPFSAEPGGGVQPGKGLWLPLARTYVEAIGGHMWFDVTPGGNTFYFSLPTR